MKKFLAIIPARGGSKSIPKKNIVELHGKPLIAWTIEESLSSKYISKTIVSSDDKEILEVGKIFGSDVIQRPKDLSMDLCKTEPVLTHVLNSIEEEFDYLVLLQPTSPLRKSHHIDDAIEMIIEKEALSLISVYEPSHSPYKAFKVNDKGFLEGLVDNEYPFYPRQNIPKAFYPNGAIYIVDIKSFLGNEKLFYENNTVLYEMQGDSNLDIDTLEELKKVQLLLNKN